MNLFKKPSAFSHYEFLEACEQTGCPVCRIGAYSARRYLKSLFYEFVNDVQTRERLNKRLGICGEHVQLLLNSKIADMLGASIIYENIIKVLLRDFPSSSAPANPKESARLIGGLMSAAKANGTCIVCDHRDSIADGILSEMSKALGDEKLQTALQKSDGLCLPHLSQLLERTSKPEDANFLLNLTRNKLETRQSEMAEVIRKSDHRFSSEKITHDEALAWKKAMSMVAGVSTNPTGDKHD